MRFLRRLRLRSRSKDLALIDLAIATVICCGCRPWATWASTKKVRLWHSSHDITWPRERLCWILEENISKIELRLGDRHGICGLQWQKNCSNGPLPCSGWLSTSIDREPSRTSRPSAEQVRHKEKKMWLYKRPQQDMACTGSTLFHTGTNSNANTSTSRTINTSSIV
jgi:hypothetical protein